MSNPQIFNRIFQEKNWEKLLESLALGISAIFPSITP